MSNNNNWIDSNTNENTDLVVVTHIDELGEAGLVEVHVESHFS